MTSDFEPEGSFVATSPGSIRHRFLLEIDELKPAEKILINKALTFAEEAHRGHFRKPSVYSESKRVAYIVHPMRVALIIIQELGLKEPETLAAALLHDVIEHSDGLVGLPEVEKQFGRSIALIISILSKPPKNENIPRENQMATYHARLAGASVSTRLIKLADRLDTLREALELRDPQQQETCLNETKETFISLAQNTDEYLHDELCVACERLEEQLKLRTVKSE
jgi:GTP diphosphokinase / guanosine-3',5'-bis(diphosphate) 3'-diphosphatase